MMLFLLSLGVAEENWNDASQKGMLRYARALSLDVRGKIPTPQELQNIEESGGISEELLDDWLHSEDFEEQVVEQHRALFWNKLSTNIVQRRRMGRQNNIYFISSRRTFYRGSLVSCGDFEATYNAQGELKTQLDEDGNIQEGWLWKTPYWDPDNPIKVCAFDAQENLVSETGAECGSLAGHSQKDCGCGPDLQWCYDNRLRSDFTGAFSQELDERVRGMLREEVPYNEFLMHPVAYVNGPMVHLFTYLAPFDDAMESYVDPESLPELAYTDKETFVPITLDAHHQGVFSSGLWLLRHQTNRGRANRFYGGFLCKEFLPVASEIEGLASSSLPSPDLSRREGCVDCHARLEPLASYWSRWGEASLFYADPESLPSFSQECATCDWTNSCSSICKDYYIVEATHSDELPYVGWLKSFAFLNEAEQDNPELGVQKWVDESVGNGALASCAAHHTSNWLLGWSDNGAIREGYAQSFIQNGYSYRELVRTIVRSSHYWRGE